MWKQKIGAKATYRNLIVVFEHAGYLGYASTVKNLVPNEPFDHGSCFCEMSLTSHSPSPPPLPLRPVFPTVTDTVFLHKQGNYR